MNYPPDFYRAATALFTLLTPFAYIALHLIRYFFPLP